MTPSRHHPTVSHLVLVAAGPAAAGLDFARWCLARPDAGWTVPTPAGTLRCEGRVRHAVPPPRAYLPHRTVSGQLYPAGRGLRPIPVTLELLPWSSRWSELLLTTGPLRRLDAGLRTERAYLLAAHAVLKRLARVIEAPPAEWVGRLVTGQSLPRAEGVRSGPPPGRWPGW